MYTSETFSLQAKFFSHSAIDLGRSKVTKMYLRNRSDKFASQKLTTILNISQWWNFSNGEQNEAEEYDMITAA